MCNTICVYSDAIKVCVYISVGTSSLILLGPPGAKSFGFCLVCLVVLEGKHVGLFWHASSREPSEISSKGF